jgi:hypothetical protein
MQSHDTDEVRFNDKSLSGCVGTLVFYMNQGQAYARSYVVPRNPDTSAQRKRRALFADAVRAWQSLPDMQKDLWKHKARRLIMSVYNLFISIFCRADGFVPDMDTLRSRSVSSLYSSVICKLHVPYSSVTGFKGRIPASVTS